MMRPAPAMAAVIIAASPTGPAPTTATASPGLTPPFWTPISKPVGRMSARKSTCSSETPSGTGAGRSRRTGTRASSACTPSIRCPKIQPIPPSASQCAAIPCLHARQRPHEEMAGTSTRSPSFSPLTAAPVSTIVPTASWPRMRPSATVGTSPLRMWRSVPQIVVVSTLTMTSVGSSSPGSSTVSHDRSPGPPYTSAFIAALLSSTAARRRGRTTSLDHAAVTRALQGPAIAPAAR